MDKLIELLNEYERSSYEKDTNWVYEGDEWEYYEPNNQIIKGNWENEEVLTQYELCSKQFGFIKWLVENDKIERLDFAQSGLLGKYTDFELSYDTPREDYTNMLLMELSIQDNPIEYLISVLR